MTAERSSFKPKRARETTEAERLRADSQPEPVFPISLSPEGRAAAGPACGARGKSGLHGKTVPGNARPESSLFEGQCHRKHTARLRTGKVERVRQERTAPPATAAAR